MTYALIADALGYKPHTSSPPPVEFKNLGSSCYWLYCCGAFATPESANKEAAALFFPKTWGGILAYHRTELNYLDRTPEELLRQARIAELIVEKIQPEITNISAGPGGAAIKDRNPLTVAAHSFGAELCYQALVRLNEDERQAITMVTFGGVRMIPNIMAGKVINYVSYNDLIASDSNRVFDPENVLARVKTVFEKIHFGEAKDIRQAILKVFARQTHDRLSSVTVKQSLDEAETQNTKISLFQNVFIFGNGDALDKKIVASGLKPWVELFQKYTISFVPTPSTQNAKEEIVLDDALCNEAIQEMVKLGQQSLQSHVIDHFVANKVEIPVSLKKTN